MNREFEQLLEDLLSGRLDEAGRRRLDELAAAQPALAGRLRKEQNLNYLLSRCGPNHAPADLAEKIMARLETRVHVRSGQPWFGWLFLQPAVRTALACTVLLAIGVEAGLWIHNRYSAPATMAAASNPTVPVEQVKIKIPKKDVEVANISPAIKKNNPRVNQTSKPDAPAPTPDAMRAAIPNPYKVDEFPAGPNSEPSLSEFPNGDARVALVTPIAPPKTGNPAIAPPKVSNPAAPAKAPAFIPDHQVAMRITLNPKAPPPPQKTQAAPAKSAMGLPGVNAFDTHTGNPKAEPLSVKEIEVLVYAVAPAAKIVKTAVAGQPNAQLLSFTMTHREFYNFASQLRGTGILPVPGVYTTSTLPAPTSLDNTYNVSHGKYWLASPATSAPALQPPTPGHSSAPAAGTATERLEIRIVVNQVKP